MKKSRWLIPGMFLFLLLGCGGTQTTGNSPESAEENRTTDVGHNENSDRGGLSTLTGDEDVTELGQNDGKGGAEVSTPYTKDIIISIPSTNDKAPDGILEQLAWSPKGGGEPDPPPCGDCSVELENSTLILRGFHPSQHLKLLVYRFTNDPKKSIDPTAEYVTSLFLEVDENGYLNSPVHGATKDLFVMHAYDSDTNELLWVTWKAEYVNNGYSPTGICPGAPPQRLKVNEMAYVCTAKDTVKLRDGPGKKYTVLKSLVSGADIKIIGGAVCSDNWSWWKVETESGYIGWMAEGGDSTDPYFVCPAP